MRKFYFLLTMLLAVTAAWSQNTYTWTGASGALWNVATNWTPNRNVVGANDTLLFSDGSTKIITGYPGGQTAGRVRVFNNTTITLQAGAAAQILTINNNTGDDLIIGAGSSLIQASSFEQITLAASARADISGTYNVQGSFILSAGSVVATVTGTLINSGTITGATAAKLIFNAGTFVHALDGGTVPTAAWNAGATLDLTGLTSAWPAGMTQTFRNVIMEGTITSDINVDHDLNILGNLTFNFTGGAGDDLNLTTSNGNSDVNVSGNVNLISGDVDMDNGNGGSVWTVLGNFTQSGGNLTEGGSGAATMVFDGTGVQTFTKSGGTISQNLNFTVNAGSTLDFGTSVLNGSAGTFTLSGGAKIITSNANGLTAASGSVQIGRSLSSTADYEFRGASTGVFATTPTNGTIRNITVNNGSGNVTLAQAMIVTGTGVAGQPVSLILTNGALTTTNALLLTIAAGGTASAPSATSFVNGPLAKTGTTAFTFPVGKTGAGYRTIGITAPTSSSTFRAEFNRANSPAGTITGGIVHKSACEYWDLSETAGTGDARVILSWEAGSACNGNYVTQISTLVVAHLIGGNWINEGQSANSGTPGAGTITSNTLISTFSPFALASTATGTTNPLPVLFDNVKAFEKNAGIQIEWSNLTERDLDGYTVERSSNGRDFVEISRQSPKSNQNDKVDYTDFDASPASGANFYRIRVNEIGGKVIYSKVLRVEIGVTKKGFSMYPNPVSGAAKQVTIGLTGIRQGQYNVRVVNSNGQDIYQKTIVNQASGITQTLVLPSTMKSGVYTMIISGDNYSQNQMFLVQ